MTERRTARRYELSLPVVVRTPVEEIKQPAHDGQTRDISTRGVYFLIDEEMSPGTELDFTLTLPAEITKGTEVFIRAHGKVVRVDRRNDGSGARLGVAAVIEKYDIIRAEPVVS
jgi:hypothetical protein